MMRRGYPHFCACVTRRHPTNFHHVVTFAEVLRPDANGKIQSLCHMECFGVVRSLATFRLPGTSTDFLVLGSDSGRVSVLEFVKDHNQFERVHLETFGKSGCRRAVAGQYLAADPKGRAVMIGAIEKQKLV